MRILFALIIMFAATPAFAEKVKVDVNGMVCDFCAQGIIKVFEKKEQVSSVDVNLTERMVLIDIKEGKTLSDEEIKQGITDNGFDVVKINRNI